MIVRLCIMAAVVIGCGLSTMSARADELLLSRDYFDRKVWRLPQNITDDIRNQIARGRFEPMVRYQTGRYHQAGRAVGRLQFLTASGHTSACTGWLIAGDQVMTNHHCVAGETPDKRAVQMRLALGVLDDRSDADILLLPVVLPPLESDASLDYAILRVEGDTSRFPPLTLNRVRDPRPGEALYLIGHPGGAPQHITRGGCQADGRDTVSGAEFAHRCDTLGGNSGSPVFADDDSALVGLHRSGGIQVNFAVRFEQIKRSSRLLASLGPAPKSIPIPRAVDDRWGGVEPSKSYRLPVLDNDAAAQGGALRVASVGGASRGRAEVAGDGRSVTYTAPSDASGGEVSFVYRVREDGGGEAEGRVTLALTTPPKPEPPVSNVIPIVGVFPQTKSVFKDCSDCPEMVVVPAGGFTMGSPSNEPDRFNDEGPQRRVNIGYSFAVGRYEVTQGEWHSLMGSDPSAFKGGRNPVEQVGWNDAKEFVKRLSAKTGKNYRLLTEAEWEYVARAGTTTAFSTGRTITTDQANFNGNYTYNGSAKGTYRQKTTPVGSFPANGFGLHDMHGNVWEWVEDCYVDSYRNAPIDGSVVSGSSYCSRVLRGGSWDDGPRILRSAYRYIISADFRINNIGFRVARTLTP